jgi:transcription termination/antitermination protein NusG
MNFYVIQVRTGGEKLYLKLTRKLVEGKDIEILWPRRKLTIRKKGKKIENSAPIFPGYLFIKSEQFPQELFRPLKRARGFTRFLETNERIKPLRGTDKELLLHFLSFGEITQKSTVTFDENNRIVVIEGPLKGLEGSIIKVDKRKGRAKVQLDLYKESFLVDLGFDVLTLQEQK